MKLQIFFDIEHEVFSSELKDRITEAAPDYNFNMAGVTLMANTPVREEGQGMWSRFLFDYVGDSTSLTVLMQNSLDLGTHLEAILQSYTEEGVK